MKLIFEDGTTFTGESFGADKNVFGEVVFNTGMSGYVETLTDPSYCGQILTTTYPLQGNYGVPNGPFESDRIQVMGMIVGHYSENPSHFTQIQSLGNWLKSQNIPGMCGVDTRSLTRYLREFGTAYAKLIAHPSDQRYGVSKGVLSDRIPSDPPFPHPKESLSGKGREKEKTSSAEEKILPPFGVEGRPAGKTGLEWASEIHSIKYSDCIKIVAPKNITRYGNANANGNGKSGIRILLIDTGAKENIVRSLVNRGTSVIRSPWNADWEKFLPEVDGVFFTNGPGDPMDATGLIERIRNVMEMDLNIPIFGICLGHQLLALAAGAKTIKMKYGHRSVNQPVRDLSNGKCYVTSQNHGYVVQTESIPGNWEPWFVNINDGTNEGIRHKTKPISSVQFHPEANPGPNDTNFLFDDYIRQVKNFKKHKKPSVKINELNTEKIALQEVSLR